MDNNFARVTFWLTLAQAFLPPVRSEVRQSFIADLADDLELVAETLDLAIADDIEALRSACRAYTDPESLLIHYSGVFLQPPSPATLNLSRYVDGGMNGPCMDALELAYAKIGLGASDRLRDLPDHASMQMEYLAYVASKQREAEEAGFARLCLVAALPRLARNLEAVAPHSPYTAFARIGALAIVRYAEDEHAKHRRSDKRSDTTIGVWRHCQNCGKPFAREKEVQVMAKALREAGLEDTHLQLCPDCRNPAQSLIRPLSR